ncbi:neutrophil defensin 4-like [Cebus imitator]|nr:neutrophil defensin 4-like [Cebus imitator]
MRPGTEDCCLPSAVALPSLRIRCPAMRTLTLLTAVLLLALQAQAGPLQARCDEAAGQEQRGVNDQDISISFAWDKSSALQVSGSTRALACTCRLVYCQQGERRAGSCIIGGVGFTYCCSLED